MLTHLSRTTAGTALAVILTLGCAGPALADISDSTPPGTQTQSDSTVGILSVSEEDPGTDPGTAPDPGTDPGTDPGAGSDPGTEPGPGTDPGAGPEVGFDPVTDPGAGSEEPKPLPETNAGTGNSEKGVSSSTDRGDRSSAYLAATGADERRTLIGSLIAAFFLTAGAAATFWSRSGVRFGRAARTDTV